MLGVSNYEFKSITDKTVKLQEYFVNSYVDEWLKSDSAINSTRRMRRILNTKY